MTTEVKNYVSFDMAQALDGCGFPRPNTNILNRHWYDRNGETWRPGSLKLNADFFAPTGPDILFDLYPDGVTGHAGAGDILRMALDADYAASIWLNKKEQKQ